MRRAIMAANWKMNLGSPQEAVDFARSLRHPLNEIEGIDKVLCPPFTALAAVGEAIGATSIELGAQNMHFDAKGAQTGEISPAMLAGMCQYVILGHSERRAMGGTLETDEAIHSKLAAAFAHGLTPILCVGENLIQQEAGETQAFVSGQVANALKGLTAEQAASCVIAYEPIWAIGTGLPATGEGANAIIGGTVRATVAALYGDDVADGIRIQYGGSVKPANIAEFMRQPEIDGALVGGASLRAADFSQIVRIGLEANL